VYEFTQQAVDFLYGEGCALVLTACNTVSVNATVKVEAVDIPQRYPGRLIMGVIEPTAEAVLASGARKVGIIATSGTVASEAYVRAIRGLDEAIEVVQQATPLLVPLIENNGLQWIEPILRHYLEPLMVAKVEAVILGCTHYPLLKYLAQEILGPDVIIISQDEVIPRSLSEYLSKHPDLMSKLSQAGSVRYCVTDINTSFTDVASQIMGQSVELEQVHLG
jgi:glutamate racemase